MKIPRPFTKDEFDKMEKILDWIKLNHPRILKEYNKLNVNALGEG